jgi:glutamine synthetase
MCDVIEPTGIGAELGVRRVLRSAVDALGRLEPGLTATIGAEAEYFLLLPSGEPAPETEVWSFICELAKTLQESGIRPEGFRFGPAKGQGRVQMRWAHPVKTADQIILYRWFASVIARRRGLSISFRPTPEGCRGAASMPVNHTLWVGTENVFHDAHGTDLTSDRLRNYAGGLLSHIDALAALTAPGRDAYPLRAGARTEVLRPYLSGTATDAVCRVPARWVSPSTRRLKFRASHANSNPYLAFAAEIAAGLDGLRRKVEPENEPAGELPSSFGQALKALDLDREFLLQAGFSDLIIDAWLELHSRR